MPAPREPIGRTSNNEKMGMRILIVAPHADDGELGCGGSIAKFVEEGIHTIYYLAFASSDPTLMELKNALKVLEIPERCLFCDLYDIRKFNEHRQAILECLISHNRILEPDLVFLPSLNDTHQDHQVIAQEGFRAFKKSSILGYEIPWNNLDFSTNTFISIKEKHVRKKATSIYCHESQREREYVSEDFIYSLAKVRGTQIGVEYAEVFEGVRWVMK